MFYRNTFLTRKTRSKNYKGSYLNNNPVNRNEVKLIKKDRKINKSSYFDKLSRKINKLKTQIDEGSLWF